MFIRCLQILLVFVVVSHNLIGQDWRWVQPSTTPGTIHTSHFPNPSIGYIAGDGPIKKTVDSGKTWTYLQIPRASAVTSIVGFGTDTLFATGVDSSIAYTFDGGNTWGTYKINCLRVLDIHAVSKSRFYAVGRDSSIFVSTDTGQTWTEQVNPTASYYLAVYFVDSLTGWAVGRSSTVIRTTDGGRTWVQSSPLPRNDHLLDVYFISPDTGWLVGNRGTLLSSVDSGKTWTLETHSLGHGPHLHGIYMNEGGTLYATGQKGVILRKDENSGEWVRIGESSLEDVTISGISTLDSNRLLAYGQLGRVYTSSDSGNTWEKISTDLCLRCIFNAVDFFNEEVGAIASSFQDSSIFITRDSGVTWSRIGVGMLVNDVWFEDSTTLYIAGSQGEARRSNDLGVTWTSVYTSQASLLSIGHDTTNGVYFLSSTGKIYRTLDGGINFDSLRVSSTAIEAKAFSIIDSSTLYVIADSGKVYNTVNGGLSWMLQRLSRSLADIWVDGSGFVAIAADSGAVFISNDGGATYSERIIDTMDDFNVISVWFQNAKTGFLASNNGHVYKTTDSGSTWQPEETYAGVAITDLYGISGHKLWGTTVLGGLISRSLPALMDTTTSTTVPRQSTSSLTLYPNPIEDEFFLKGDLVEEVSSLRVYNLMGEFLDMVKGNNSNSNGLRFSVEGLSKGVYILQVMYSNGSRQSIRFVKE